MSILKNITIRLALALAVAILPASLASAQEIFAELAECPQVESSYVSGKFSQNAPSLNAGGRRIDFTQGFSALYTYECYSEEAVKKAKKILSSYLSKNPEIQTMMRNRHGMEEYTIYEKFYSDESLAQMIVWSTSSPNACEIVVIDWNPDTKSNKDDDDFY